MRGDPSVPIVLTPEEVPGAPPDCVGGKAATLARLAGRGIAVPPFHVLSAGAFVLHLAENGIRWPGADPGRADPDALGEIRARIREAPVPEPVARAAAEAYERLCAGSGHRSVAVRSSAAEEDTASASYAGQFSSILGVGAVGDGAGTDDLADAVRECWASSLSARSLRYRAGLGAPPGPVPRFAVILQTQVFSEKSGVLFTMHPFDPEGVTAYVEAGFGTGESVVGGLATPDGITLARSTGQVVETRIATKRRMTVVRPGSRRSALVDVDPGRQNAPVLTEQEAAAVLEAGLRIEELLGAPQDVEWAFDSERLWILQSRPITGLGSGVA